MSPIHSNSPFIWTANIPHERSQELKYPHNHVTGAGETSVDFDEEMQISLASQNERADWGLEDIGGLDTEMSEEMSSDIHT